jgi:hypothetical protein
MHGMGGNVGDAIAPIVIGAASELLRLAQVVVLNLVPGLVVALLLFVYLGTMRLGGAKSAKRRSRLRVPERRARLAAQSIALCCSRPARPSAP